MAVFGKILGSAAGLAIGGPLGAIAGLALGHFMDRRSPRPDVPPSIKSRHGPRERSKAEVQAAFAVAFVTLAAKLSKADGQVTRDEVDVLKRIFSIPASASREIAAIFDSAKADAAGFEAYARQIAAIVRGDTAMLEHVLAGLAQIAAADGSYHTAERNFIHGVAREFGFSPEQCRRIEQTYIPTAIADAVDPYGILGVSRDATDEEIRKSYRGIIMDFHPDRLESKGLPEEFRELGARKTAEASEAYERIKKARNLS